MPGMEKTERTSGPSKTATCAGAESGGSALPHPQPGEQEEGPVIEVAKLEDRPRLAQRAKRMRHGVRLNPAGRKAPAARFGQRWARSGASPRTGG
jgi:hypothetical protein